DARHHRRPRNGLHKERLRQRAASHLERGDHETGWFLRDSAANESREAVKDTVLIDVISFVKTREFIEQAFNFFGGRRRTNKRTQVLLFIRFMGGKMIPKIADRTKRILMNTSVMYVLSQFFERDTHNPLNGMLRSEKRKRIVTIDRKVGEMRLNTVRSRSVNEYTSKIAGCNGCI
ncbi:MAG: hypothetical protein O3A21_09595, partial [Proteobacteria bacterium]|nr:hypothetical protein [Pseudomonadota bacterium]